MIEAIIFLSALFWLVLQFQGNRPLKWKRRTERLQPLGRYVKADLRALFRRSGATERDSTGLDRVEVPDYPPEDL